MGYHRRNPRVPSGSVGDHTAGNEPMASVMGRDNHCAYRLVIAQPPGYWYTLAISSGRTILCTFLNNTPPKKLHLTHKLEINITSNKIASHLAGLLLWVRVFVVSVRQSGVRASGLIAVNIMAVLLAAKTKHYFHSIHKLAVIERLMKQVRYTSLVYNFRFALAVIERNVHQLFALRQNVVAVYLH